jgi:predicted permease
MMKRSILTGQRLVAVFLLGCVLFNYPVIALFNKTGELFDIPLLYLFLFGAWALLIGLMAWVIEHPQE